MTPPAAVLFDMDGTLLRLDVDIEEARTRLAALFAPHGVTRPFRPILRRIREAAAEAAERGADRAELERQGFAVLSALEVECAAQARARAGAADVVRELAARGVRLGIVTDNGRACVPVALRVAGVPDVFTAIATRDDVELPKPDPAGIVLVARACGGEGGVWYVGDHPKDVQAGRAAAAAVPGLRVAAIRGGYASDADLERAGADVLVGSLGEVLGLVTA